jgi:DNA-binding response OmpR family regulator
VHILYVSDGEPDDYLLRALREAGHVVETAAEPGDGPVMAGQLSFDTAILDGPIPRREWTQSFARTGAMVVVIASHATAAERARTLRAGADACFTRPVAFAELEARLQALRRGAHRADGQGTEDATQGLDFELAPARRTVGHASAEIGLSAIEFRMLEHLTERAGEVVAIATLRRAVWGDEVEAAAEPVHRCALRLRRKLAALGARASIEAIPGHGYALRPESKAFG